MRDTLTWHGLRDPEIAGAVEALRNEALQLLLDKYAPHCGRAATTAARCPRS